MRHQPNTRITDRDAARLARIVENLLRHAGAVEQGAEALHDRLDAARITPATEIAADVVTMNTKMVIEDAKSGERQSLTLAYPEEADAGQGRISVLSPLGNAVLGASKGDEVDVVVPTGVRRVRIVDVRFQPEAAGQYEL